MAYISLQPVAFSDRSAQTQMPSSMLIAKYGPRSERAVDDSLTPVEDRYRFDGPAGAFSHVLLHALGGDVIVHTGEASQSAGLLLRDGDKEVLPLDVGNSFSFILRQEA